jgi:hypothetical protein
MRENVLNGHMIRASATPAERQAALDAMTAHRDARDASAALSAAYKEHDQRYQMALLIYLNLG